MADMTRPQRDEDLEIMPLWDMVKLDIYNAFLQISEMRKKILEDKAEGFKPKGLAKYKANLVSLYGFLIVKIHYPKGTEFDKLLNMNKRVSNPASMSDAEAEEYYLLFNLLIERLGISRIGKENMNTPDKAPFERSER